MPKLINTAAGAGALAVLTSFVPFAAGELRAQAPPEYGGLDVGRAATITATDMRRRVGVLAHDSMGGRNTPSPGLTKAAGYIAREFESIGLKPAMGPDYFQWYPLTAIQPGAASRQSLALRHAGEEHRLDPSRDFIALPVGPSANASGPLSRASAAGEADSEGKVLVVLATSQTLGDQLGQLREQLAGGAVGALIALDAPERYVDGVRQFFGRSSLSVGEPDVRDMPVAIVPVSSLPGALHRAIEAREALDGWSADLRSSATVQVDSAMNVVAWLEGSDPELRSEYVIFTAHMDHVGIGRPLNGDSIYNGADDDASGTAGIIELAQAFATGDRPRRSLVFMTVSGEEKGLLGSEWYSEHPLFPLEKTVANINLDMIGRNWVDTIVAIGKEESSLGPTVERIAAGNPELGLSVIDDLWPEERFYFRSDHYNFARKGVPILFFFNGVHADYHRPSDEADKLEYEKAARIVQLVYLLGLEVANADERPAWNPEAYKRVVEGADE
jgi:hypothetical protein